MTAMGRLLYRVVDTIIVTLCLPFYAVAVPLMRLHDWAVPRFRRVQLGIEVSHCPALDVREDLLVADVSQLVAGRVGVRRRTWHLLGHSRSSKRPPPYGEAVEFWPVAEFWLGRRLP